MGEPRGFIKYQRVDPHKQEPSERIQHFSEFTQPLEPKTLREQGARCMDCGVPFVIAAVHSATTFPSGIILSAPAKNKRL